MKVTALNFVRPPELQATEPPEARGLQRDEVRLLVSRATPTGVYHHHARFYELADFLRDGDLLVVNQSATLAASLPAHGAAGDFLLNLATNYGAGLWLAEPRWSSAQPGPLAITPGETIELAGASARFVMPYPGLPRLWFVQTDADLETLMQVAGQPIRYGYVNQDYPLSAYQTIFATVPGSAEMPSAARPFTPRVIESLHARGVQVVGLTLHTGVSSLEIESEEIEDHSLYAEYFEVPSATAEAINRAHAAGQRVIAVGTTVVRALESAWDGEQVQAWRGFTRRYVRPSRPVATVDGLLTGLHDPLVSHLAMLYALAGQALIQEAYAEAVAHGYLWHEFGDSHLILLEKEA